MVFILHPARAVSQISKVPARCAICQNVMIMHPVNIEVIQLLAVLVVRDNSKSSGPNLNP